MPGQRTQGLCVARPGESPEAIDPETVVQISDPESMSCSAFFGHVILFKPRHHDGSPTAVGLSTNFRATTSEDGAGPW